MAFYDFYVSLGGHTWTNNSGWSSAAAGVATSYKTFYGLTWSPTTGLTKIVLTNNNLAGTIPASTGTLIANFTSTSFSFMIGDGGSSRTTNGNNVCGIVPANVASLCNSMGSSVCSIYSYTYYSASVSPAILSLKNCSSVPGSNFTCLASDDPDTCAVMASLLADTHLYTSTTLDIYQAGLGYPTKNGICDVPRFSTCVSGASCSSYSTSVTISCDSLGNVVSISGSVVAAPYPAQLAPNIGLLSSLKSITIYSDNLGGTIPDSVGLLTALTYMRLGAGAGTNLHMTGPVPDIWAGLTALTTLDYICWLGK